MLPTSRPSIALLMVLMITLGLVSFGWRAEATAALIQVATEEPELVPIEEDELDDTPLDIPLGYLICGRRS